MLEPGAFSLGANCPGHPGVKSSCPLRPPGGDGESVKLSIPFFFFFFFNFFYLFIYVHPFQTRQNTTITANFTKFHGNQETSLLLFIPLARLDARGDESSELEVCVLGVGGGLGTHACIYSLHLLCEELPPRIQPVATRGLSFSHGSCRAVFSAFYLFLREQTHYTSCI